MNAMTHNIISLFQQSAALLNMQNSREDLDDAIHVFASWIQSNAHELTEDDLVVLTMVGGIMYREGMTRRDTGN